MGQVAGLVLAFDGLSGQNAIHLKTGTKKRGSVALL